MRTLLFGVVLSALLVSPALACGPKGPSNIPALASSIDALLPDAKLADADLAKIKELRAQITKLAAAGKKDEARRVEEKAMTLLGYRKMWLKCGPGTFAWWKIDQPRTQ